MDIKSMAKSKRSHTHHHQPRKPHNPPKTSSSSSSSTSAIKKDGVGKKKTTQPKPPSLPSNWDRYEDEDDVHEIPIYSDSGNTTQSDGSNAKMGVNVNEVKPKSKGADFKDLIAQAQQSRTYNSPSFDDKLPDCYQGAAPMLAARGEKIILQDRDDDFLMEDEAGGNPEAPFLTLDLEDLAEQLSKIDLAERLFIEPDLLPPDLRQDANEADNHVPFRMPERPKIHKVDSFDELLALYLEEEHMAKTEDDVDKHGVMSSSNVSSCHDSKADASTKSMGNLGFPDAREALQVNHAGEKDANSKLDDAGHVDETIKQTKTSRLKDSKFHDGREMTQSATEQDITASSRFEAAAAEEELDLLLGSFTETKLFDTSVTETGTSASTKAPVQHSLGQPEPTFPITASLDDELDDLLAITSNPNNNDGLSLPQSFQVPSSSSSQPNSKSLVLEDFDLWLDTL